MLIGELMTTPAVTVTGDTAISEALRLLDDHKITAMPVVDRHGDLVGVVSEADMMQDALHLDDRVPTVAVRVSSSAPPRHVAEVMTHLVVSVHSDDDLDTAIDLLRSTMVKSLPVLQQGRVIGMISRSDVIHLLAGRDQRIRGDIADLLRAESLDWQVEVRDGVAMVTGPTSEQEHQQAEVLATTVRGVIAVHIP